MRAETVEVKAMKPKHTTVWITPTLHNELLDYSKELQERLGGEPVTLSRAIEHLLECEGTAPAAPSAISQRQEQRAKRAPWRPARRLKE